MLTREPFLQAWVSMMQKLITDLSVFCELYMNSCRYLFRLNLSHQKHTSPNN